jgi:hypothetical protein
MPLLSGPSIVPALTTPTAPPVPKTAVPEVEIVPVLVLWR